MEDIKLPLISFLVLFACSDDECLSISQRKDDSFDQVSREDFQDTLDIIDDGFFLIRRDGDSLPGVRRDKMRDPQGGSLIMQGSSSSGGGGWTPSYMAEFPDGGARQAPEEEVPSIEWVLEKAKAAVRR